MLPAYRQPTRGIQIVSLIHSCPPHLSTPTTTSNERMCARSCQRRILLLHFNSLHTSRHAIHTYLDDRPSTSCTPTISKPPLINDIPLSVLIYSPSSTTYRCRCCTKNQNLTPWALFFCLFISIPSSTPLSSLRTMASVFYLHLFYFLSSILHATPSFFLDFLSPL